MRFFSYMNSMPVYFYTGNFVTPFFLFKKQKRIETFSNLFLFSNFFVLVFLKSNYPTKTGAVNAKSNGKLCAFLSCITSIPKFARLTMSAHVLITLP